MTVPDLYRALWRHKLFIVVLTAGVAVAAWYLTSQQPKMYKASTLVRIQQRISDPTEAWGALQTGQRLAQTYARITTTSTIAAEIHQRLGGQVKLNQVKLSAKQVNDLELLTISATNRDPKRAAMIANVAPDALRTFISETGTLRDQVIMVQAAGVPTSPTSPSLKTNVMIAIVLGLIFNGALALMIEMLSDRVHDPEELERLTGKPVLTTVPVLEFARPPSDELGDTRLKVGPDTPGWAPAGGH